MNAALRNEIDNAFARIHQGVAEYPFIHDLITYNLHVLQALGDAGWEIRHGHYYSCDKCALNKYPATETK